MCNPVVFGHDPFHRAENKKGAISCRMRIYFVSICRAAPTFPSFVHGSFWLSVSGAFRTYLFVYAIVIIKFAITGQLRGEVNIIRELRFLICDLVCETYSFKYSS